MTQGCSSIWATLILVLATLAGCRAHPSGKEALVVATPPSSAPLPAHEPASEGAPAPAPGAVGASAPDASSGPDAMVAADPALARAPLPGFFEALPVPGFPDAWLSLPTGATGKRPVVVVIHGAGDRPDWQCGGWRRATREYAFVLCPRGHVDKASSTRNDVRYTHFGGAPLLEYVDAALGVLGARYPEYADTSTPLFAGFSLGAAEIVALAVKSPSRFPRLALVEGGTNAWSDARIDTFLSGGGRRVLFGCGQEGVLKSAKGVAKRLLARGLDTRAVFAPVGHTFDPPLEDAVRSELAWWVEGDPRWPSSLFEP
jgi:predicted esterase